jgi:hypothetical protein
MTQQQIDDFLSLPDDALVSASEVCSGRSAGPNVLRINAKDFIEQWIHPDDRAEWFDAQYPSGGQREQKEFDKELEDLKHFDVASIKHLVLCEQDANIAIQDQRIPPNVRALFESKYSETTIPMWAKVQTTIARLPKEKLYRTLKRQVWTLPDGRSVTIDSDELAIAVSKEKNRLSNLKARATTEI